MAPIRLGVRPARAMTFERDIICGRIAWADIWRARRVVQRVAVDNESTSWNCQSWVFAALRELRRRRLLRVRRAALERLRFVRERWQ